ncbi:hypothetical protein PFFCH_00376 [Plasmodium falciparum FCH/4]|uniref:Uncharacterized protein n=1 Tax=Plasmodium falciparum FCH/4 TaxID=1036724 RepID=A0A024VVF6_PLAFA|nr:hypothetical protein PFFCH_00376 [Plasmodium falciparum FCH/4]
MFPSFINNKVFVLRNVIQQFRLLKELVIKIINIITLIISICPYNNERIILENLRKRNIIKKENNKIINHMEKRNDEEKYTNISSFDMIHITNIYDDDKLFVYNKQYENKSLYNNFFIVEKKIPFINFLQEKEKIMLSQFNDFTNYQTKNNHIILFILKKIQRILQYIPQSLKFLKSYISYRLCEINRFGNFYINNSPLITNLLDKTNEFIKSIENFNYIHIHNIIYTKLSYINYHTPYLYKQHMTYINNINQTFNKAKVHTYDKLQKNLKDLQNFKKDNIQLNMKLLKSKKENKKLKTVNQETLNNFRNILLENQELSLNNQYLINSIDNKREDKQYSNDNNNIQTYAEKIYNFISHTDEGKKNFNIKEKQLIEAYISSCIKINNLNLEIQNNKHVRKNYNFKIYMYPYSDLYKSSMYGNNFKILPNKKTKSREYEIIKTSNNTYSYTSPYPPNINYTLTPYPESSKKMYYENRKYIMKYKNVEYIPIKRLTYKNASKKTNWNTYYIRMEK